MRKGFDIARKRLAIIEQQPESEFILISLNKDSVVTYIIEGNEGEKLVKAGLFAMQQKRPVNYIRGA